MTAGHLATSPRMVKVATALSEEGHSISFVSSRFVSWADEADRAIVSARGSQWSWRTVDYRRTGAPLRYFYSGIRFHGARWIFPRMRSGRWQPTFAALARDRVFPELASAIAREKPQFIFGGGSALAPTAWAARRLGVPFALDLEDFHSAEDRAGPLAHLTETIERKILREAALLTAGSQAIADAYSEKYGVRPLAIHNVFPLPPSPPEPLPRGSGLRLYWFGQTIGPGRGIEDAIEGAGRAGLTGELHLRGVATADYLRSLRSLAENVAPKLTLVRLDPASPEKMVELCRPYDVGIALERPERYSQALALTNKALTYVLAGLAVAVTDTPGQHEFGTSLGNGAVLCAEGDIDCVAGGLARWASDPAALLDAKRAAWAAAVRRWHWEHPHERARLVAAVAATLR